MSTTDPAAPYYSAASTCHWHPGEKSCGYCDYPATRIVKAGNGTEAAVCDNHIRCGTGHNPGDHHTYMVHPNAYHAMLG